MICRSDMWAEQGGAGLPTPPDPRDEHELICRVCGDRFRAGDSWNPTCWRCYLELRNGDRPHGSHPPAHRNPRRYRKTGVRLELIGDEVWPYWADDHTAAYPGDGRLEPEA